MTEEDYSSWIGRKLTLPEDLVPESFGRRVEVIDVANDIVGKPYLKVRSVETGREAAVDPTIAHRLADN